jgi:hypothetical protein
MAYVPGFEWDIFFSYPMEAQAWTRQIETDLKHDISLAAAKGLKVYCAQRNWEIGFNSDDMLAAARTSALFVAVLTRDALEDEDKKRFLQREMEAFRGAARQAGRSLNGRFCPISLYPIDELKLSRAMPLDNPQAFWNMNVKFYFDYDGDPIVLTRQNELQPGLYSRTVSRVAHQLRKRLDEIATGKSAPADVGGAFSGRAIFLAPVELNSAARTEWEDVRKLLLNDGATVVPDDPRGDDSAAMESAELFVQLLSPLDSLSVARAQLKLAEAHKVKVFQWRKKLPNPKQDVLVLDGLDEEDKEFCQGAGTGLLEQFKVAIREELQKIREDGEKKLRDEADKLRDPNDAGKLPAQSGTHAKPYLYITADTVDRRLALELQAVAVKRAVAVVMDQDETQRQSDFVEGLKMASAMVFLYGQTTPHFVDRWVNRFIRESRSLKIYPKIVAVYLAPPERTAEEEPQKPFAELRVLGSHTQFTPEEIDRLCAEL